MMMLALCPTEGAIVNGGFEDSPDFNGWTVTQDPVDPLNPPFAGYQGTTVSIYTGSPNQYAQVPHAGSSKSAAFISDNGAPDTSFARISNPAVTTASTLYNVSLWVSNPIQDPSNTFNAFSLTWNGNPVSLTNSNLTETSPGSQVYVVKGQTDWFQIVATNLPATGASTDLVISARNNNWATLVDDVLVEVVPEPTTMVMLSLGFAAIGFRRRRQQRA